MCVQMNVVVFSQWRKTGRPVVAQHPLLSRILGAKKPGPESSTLQYKQADFLKLDKHEGNLQYKQRVCPLLHALMDQCNQGVDE